MNPTPRPATAPPRLTLPPAARDHAIRRQVFRSLGFPPGLVRLKVHPLGDDHYRVNVHVGCKAASSRIADSFFLTADEGGNILSSSPRIVRAY
jgi:hypothetical protein